MRYNIEDDVNDDDEEEGDDDDNDDDGDEDDEQENDGDENDGDKEESDNDGDDDNDDDGDEDDEQEYDGDESNMFETPHRNAGSKKRKPMNNGVPPGAPLKEQAKKARLSDESQEDRPAQELMINLVQEFKRMQEGDEENAWKYITGNYFYCIRGWCPRQGCKHGHPHCRLLKSVRHHCSECAIKDKERCDVCLFAATAKEIYNFK